MRLELFIALRYLLARRKQALISVISLISTIGVGVGVIALIIALALMTGLQGELRDRILGSTAHIYVQKSGGIEDYRAEVQKLLTVPRVLGAAPAIMGKALISSPQAQRLHHAEGHRPGPRAKRHRHQEDAAEGECRGACEAAEGELPGILHRHDSSPKRSAVEVGDTVNLLTDQGTLSPGGMVPRNRPARVAGIFALGLQEFDAAVGLCVAANLPRSWLASIRSR